MRMAGNNEGSGELHERALSDWFSTETMKDDFYWSICYARKIAQLEFIRNRDHIIAWPRKTRIKISAFIRLKKLAKAMFRFQNESAKIGVGYLFPETGPKK